MRSKKKISNSKSTSSLLISLTHAYLPYILKGDDELQGREAKPTEFRNRMFSLAIVKCNMHYFVDYEFNNWKDFH